MDKGITIDTAICVYCEDEGLTGKVEIKASIGCCWAHDGMTRILTLYDNVYTYFSCERHGAVPAIVNGQWCGNPVDLFKGKMTLSGQK